MIRKGKPVEAHCESYDWAPQWIYIHDMHPGMFAKSTANALVSVLGTRRTPLHVGLIDTINHPQCLRACIPADPNFAYPLSIPYVIDDDLRETAGELKVTCRSRASRCIKCSKFGHCTNGCPVEKISISMSESMAGENSIDDHRELILEGLTNVLATRQRPYYLIQHP